MRASRMVACEHRSYHPGECNFFRSLARILAMVPLVAVGAYGLKVVWSITASLATKMVNLQGQWVIFIAAFASEFSRLLDREGESTQPISNTGLHRASEDGRASATAKLASFSVHGVSAANWRTTHFARTSNYTFDATEFFASTELIIAKSFSAAWTGFLDKMVLVSARLAAINLPLSLPLVVALKQAAAHLTCIHDHPPTAGKQREICHC